MFLYIKNNNANIANDTFINLILTSAAETEWTLENLLFSKNLLLFHFKQGYFNKILQT